MLAIDFGSTQKANRTVCFLPGRRARILARAESVAGPIKLDYKIVNLPALEVSPAGEGPRGMGMRGARIRLIDPGGIQPRIQRWGRRDLVLSLVKVLNHPDIATDGSCGKGQIAAVARRYCPKAPSRHRLLPQNGGAAMLVNVKQAGLIG
jgi:hypothetical protein